MQGGSREILIAPKRAARLLDVREVLEFRELLYFLTWRDIKVRYKQSLLGVGWVVLRPLVSMVIFSAVLGRWARVPSESVPYPVFVLLGLVPWGFFAGALSTSTASVVAGSNLISKVYFPRIIVPVASVLSQAVDAAISLGLLLVVMLAYGVTPSPKALLVPLLLLAVALTALGPGLLFSAANVKYRDVGQITPFLVQIWMFVTPVLYPASFVPEGYRWLLYLNPMTGVVEMFRGTFLADKAVEGLLLAMSVAVSLVLLIVGLAYFRAVERTFADNI